MGKRIIAFALAGWTAIVAVAWKLADARIGLCYFADDPCLIRTTAARDYVLVAGLTVALIFVVVVMLLAAIARVRAVSPGWRSANPEPHRRALPR